MPADAVSMPFIARPTGRPAALFGDPPHAFSPVPIWWWSGDRLEPARLRWQLERLVEGGVRQAVVLNLAPNGPVNGSLADEPEFLSDAWWAVFEGVCRDAQELGFRLWFYDQLGFSGADLQGRIVQREPDCRGRALARVAVEVEGSGSVRCPPGGQPLAAFALPARGAPVRLPIAGESARWSGTGRCRLLLVYAVARGFDYLSPGACALLLDCVHGAFERRVGHHLGSTIVGSFQDELPSMPTWSATFADEFLARRGYDLVDHLPALWGHGDPSVRVDYQRTRADLAEKAFFRPHAAWHHERGLVAGCDQQHPARAGYPLEATQQYADYLRTHRWFGASGSDHWGEANLHSSLAHLYDHPRTWIEAFHTTGWGGTLEETYDWLLPWLRAGANLYNPHAVYYATVGGRWEFAPPSTCWRQPYWRHYPLFAAAVSRLCAVLSWGDHACDVAVLFPTTTVQAELDLGHGQELLGQPAGTSAAQDAYLDVVGRMHWFEPRPGALDRDLRDFDVLDDASVVRGEAGDGVLRIGAEAFRAIVLPHCPELEPATATALRAFADAGGVLVAVGDAPDALADVVRVVPTAADLADAIADVARTVSAPVPTLLRTDGDSAVVLVVGAAQGATEQPPGRAWRTEGYRFDPARYARSVPVSVRGVDGPAALWDPGTGTATALRSHRDGDLLHLEVPLDQGPCGVVVLGPAVTDTLASGDGEVFMARAPGVSDGAATMALGDWTGQPLPTLDNRWGDFARPAGDAPMPIQVWHLEQRDPTGEGWHDVRTTFGARAEVRRGTGGWEPVVWSDRFGAAGDTREPRGYVPEEFVDLGDVADGEDVELRVAIRSGSASPGALTVGSTADTTIRWNGVVVAADASVYYDQALVDVRAGDNLLEVGLTAATARRLRASWSLRPAPEPLPRPEWVTGEVLRRTFEIVTEPTTAVLQLGTLGRVELRVNDAVVARHGEFDNYEHARQPRVRRYDLREFLVVGENRFELVLHEPEAAAVVDGFVDDRCLVTDASWSGAPGGVREVPYDPRWIQLRPRPHPLPAVDDGSPSGGHLGVALPPTPPGEVETFRFALPPGATAFRLPATGTLEVLVDDAPVEADDGIHRLRSPAAAGMPVTVHVWGGPGTGGGTWTGPVEVWAPGDGAVPLGDWSGVGLRDWSGGLRYRTVVPGPVAATALDLGAVRGTAELRVNGRAAGTRIWSPYRFDVADLLDREENVVEVDVYNTLAPFVAAVSASPWVLPGQTASGLLGPVTLHLADPPPA